MQSRAGFALLRVTGRGGRALFAGEVGGHRWQRVPPTEKRGRIQSSTITVAVLDEEVPTTVELPESDLEWTACRSPGKGGQHVQKTDSAVQVTHLPTGIYVRSHDGRSQFANKQDALDKLHEKLLDAAREAASSARAAERRGQVGSGMRGDKRRTIRAQDDSVVDHLTGKSWRLRDYERGNWD
ncbi:MAG: peptide chain release factor-like protein [Polyangiales bacterium]